MALYVGGGEGLIHCTLCGGGGPYTWHFMWGEELYLTWRLIFMGCMILLHFRLSYHVASCIHTETSPLCNSLISITEGSAGPVSTVQPASQVAQPDHSALVAMETAKVKAEYEKQLTEMKAMYEAEQMSKQKLQEEMERLHNNYDKKVHDIEDHYSHDVTAGAMATAQGGQFNGGIAEGASESVISVIPITDQVNNHANLVISLYCIFCCASIGTYWS